MSETTMSGCGCIYSNIDGERNDFDYKETRKARKEYRCCECRYKIPKGTSYQIDTIKSDGEISSFRTCLPCAEIREALCCDGWTFGQLYDDAAESIFETFNHGCLSELVTAAAKQKLVDQWRHWKELP